MTTFWYRPLPSAGGGQNNAFPFILYSTQRNLFPIRNNLSAITQKRNCLSNAPCWFQRSGARESTRAALLSAFLAQPPRDSRLPHTGNQDSLQSVSRRFSSHHTRRPPASPPGNSHCCPKTQLRPSILGGAPLCPSLAWSGMAVEEQAELRPSAGPSPCGCLLVRGHHLQGAVSWSPRCVQRLVLVQVTYYLLNN